MAGIIRLCIISMERQILKVLSYSCVGDKRLIGRSILRYSRVGILFGNSAGLGR